jgi:hypothetical protein
MHEMPSPIKGLQATTKVCHENNSSSSSSSHQDKDVSSDNFEKQTYGMGYQILTNMGYNRRGLGISGQDVTNPIQVKERPHYAGLRYEEVGECSKIVEEAQPEQVLCLGKGIKTITHDLDMRDGRQSMYVQDSPSKKKAK